MAEPLEPPSKRPRTEGHGTAFASGGSKSMKQMTLFGAFAKKKVDVPTPMQSNLDAGSQPQNAGVGAKEAEAPDPVVQSEWVPRVGQGWCNAMGGELKRPSTLKPLKDVAELRANPMNVIFPPASAVFRAFLATPFEAVKVVIVGQDPYHGRGQAMGLSFSVPRGVGVPPSLQNMLKEAGVWPSKHGDLTSWTEQGVLLLNTVLTVQEGKPLSHKNIGWDRFTDAAIRALSRERKDVIFLLWGREAQAKAKMIDTPRHTILQAGHPSPLSYEKHFKGCGHFQKVNDILSARGEPSITWQLPQ